MLWLNTVLLAAVASSDSLIIGFNYGIKGVRIGNVSNVFLSLVCFAGTLLSMLAGRMAGCFLDPVWGQLAGGVLFALMGLYMLTGALKARDAKEPPERCQTVRCYSENPEMVDRDSSKVIELRESMMIGLLLCVNNVALGIGGGMTGIPLLFAPLACAVLSFLFVKAGCFLGGRIEQGRLARTLEIISAGVILLLGIKEAVAFLL